MGPEQEWRDYLRQGKFMLQQEKETKMLFFPPRSLSPDGKPLEWQESSGGGTVYSVTTIRKKDDADSYHVALIDLDDGPRLMSRVVGIPHAEVVIGLKVKARIDEIDGESTLQFEKA